MWVGVGGKTGGLLSSVALKSQDETQKRKEDTAERLVTRDETDGICDLLLLFFSTTKK